MTVASGFGDSYMATISSDTKPLVCAHVLLGLWQVYMLYSLGFCVLYR